MKKTDWLPCNEAPPIREGYYEVRLWESKGIPADFGKVMRFYFDGKRWRNRSDGYRLVVEDRPGWHKKDEWRGVERRVGSLDRKCSFCGAGPRYAGEPRWGYTKDLAEQWVLSCPKCCAESGGAVREIAPDGVPGASQW